MGRNSFYAAAFLALSMLPATAARSAEPAAQSDEEKQKAEALEAINAMEKRSEDRERAAAEKALLTVKKNNNFTLNILGMFSGGVGVEYTRGLGGVASLGISAGYVAPVIFPYSAVLGQLTLLFWVTYPNNGFYVGPYIGVQQSYPSDSGAVGALSVTPGLKVGYRWIWNSGLNVGLGAAFGWAFQAAASSCSGRPSCSVIGPGPTPAFVLDVGYAF